MKKRIFNIVLIGILSIFSITGCIRVGASDISKDLNSDKKNIQNNLSQKEGHADNDKVDNDKDEKENEVNPDKNEDVKTETNEEDENVDNSEENGGNKTEDIPNSDDIKTHYSGNGAKKLVALTFDDGPESELTPQILDLLDEYNIKATFFIIGQNAAKNTDILKDIHSKGHEIGNHSWSHKYLPKISKKSKEDEILKTERLLIDVLGEYTPIFRPPYGAVKKQDKELIDSLGYKIVNCQ